MSLSNSAIIAVSYTHLLCFVPFIDNIPHVTSPPHNIVRRILKSDYSLYQNPVSNMDFFHTNFLLSIEIKPVPCSNVHFVQTEIYHRTQK